MKFGITLRPPSLSIIDSYLEQMKPGGVLENISHFEISYVSSNLGHDWRSDYLTGVKQRIDDNGLTASIHFPSFNLSEVNQGIQKVIISEFREMLEYCNQLNLENIVLHPGYLDYYETPKVVNKAFVDRMERDMLTATNHSVAMLKTLSSMADEYGLTILLENMPLPRAITKNCHELHNLKNLIHRNNVKFVLDTGHLHLTGNDMHENIISLGEDLRQIHVHDNNTEYDQHRVPGLGTIKWDSFAKSLIESNFSGIIIIELGESSLEEISQSAKFLTTLLEGTKITTSKP